MKSAQSWPIWAAYGGVAKRSVMPASIFAGVILQIWLKIRACWRLHGQCSFRYDQPGTADPDALPGG